MASWPNDIASQTIAAIAAMSPMETIRLRS
jgi:hypothetical protein